MNHISPDLEGLSLSKNSDGTYTGRKEVDVCNETSKKIHKSILEYPRLYVKWIDNIENGTIESIQALADIEPPNIFFKITE